jgi:MYXO-CTERM domain-containing protein
VEEFEQQVPDEARNPEPPEMSEAEKATYEAADKEEKKRLEEQAKEVERRRATMKRYEDHVVTRLHYRYDKAALPKDVVLKEAPHAKGGVDVPKGPAGSLPQEIASGGDVSELQTRYTHLHPNKAVIKCEDPKHHRWGKAPRTYRGLRKIWVAQDLARKKRDLFKTSEVVLTSIPALDITVADSSEPKADESAPVEAESKEGSKCGCRLPGEGREVTQPSVLALLALGLGLWRRRRAR